MTASLQVKKGRPNYYVVLAYKEGGTGKNRTKWISTDIPIKGNNKRLAEKRRVEILAEHESQKLDLSKDILFDVYLDNWLTNARHTIEPNTYEIYRLNVDRKIIPYFKPLKIRLRDLTPLHLQSYVNMCMETLSANTVRKHMVNISKCLESAVRQNIISYNPAKRFDWPKKTVFTGAQHYTEQEINDLIAKSKGDELESVILLTVFYGLRRSEVLGLKWSAIDLENDILAINHVVVNGIGGLHKKDTTKNISSRSNIPLAGVIKERLIELKAKQQANRSLQPNDYTDSDYICTFADGRLFRPDFISKHFQLLLHRIGMRRIRFHDLRHSAANYLLALGADLKEIQTWLRHADIQTTANIYLHMNLSEKRGIADSLNERFSNFGRV